MPRDAEIKRAFEVADDSMQGVIGYFLYGIACKRAADKSGILEHLPKETIQITHEWNRYYQPEDLHAAMCECFEPYHARVALISVISIFEGALSRFVERLTAEQKIGRQPRSGYKARLTWAFALALESTYGSRAIVARVPDLCLLIDHARRIRNLWMHNNGLFDARYATDGIPVPGSKPVVDPLFDKSNGGTKPVSLVLIPGTFLSMALSHIELLHHLHDVIQRRHFGQKKSYSYRASRKSIEWHRCLTGR